MIHIFEPAITLPDRTKPKKRKRNADVEYLTDDEHTTDNHSDSGSSESERADQADDQDLESSQAPTYSTLQEQEKTDVSNESPSFPHAPARPSPGHASPRPPFSRLSNQQRRNLRRQHLYTMTTVLHKCLQAQDYPRASRAFGLLLRFEVGGRRMDLRKNHLWGIGAEILLHRDKQRDHATGALYVDGLDETQDEMWFTSEGFEAAKMYYERLIVQYPYRATRPNDVCAMQFYPVMFGLWINHIQGQSKRARRKAEVDFVERDRGASNVDDGIDDDMSLSDQVSSPPAPDHDRNEPQNLDEMITSIRNQELQQAMELVERLERLTALPPYDRASRLLRQQGMAYLWIADLYDETVKDKSRSQEYRVRAKDTFMLIKRCDEVMWEQVKHYVDSDDTMSDDGRSKRRERRGKENRKSRKQKSKN